MGQLEAAFTDVGTGTEDSYFQMLLRVAGAALTSCYRFAATGAFNAIFTHANSAARTYTLPDATGTVILSTSQQAVKVWARITITPTLTDSFNVTSVADGGAGVVTVTVDTDFANTTYSVIPAVEVPDYMCGYAVSSATAFNITLDAHEATSADQACSAIAVGDS